MKVEKADSALVMVPTTVVLPYCCCLPFSYQKTVYLFIVELDSLVEKIHQYTATYSSDIKIPTRVKVPKMPT